MRSTTIKNKGDTSIINFKNTGHSEWNDVIHDQVFELESTDYLFVLEPKTNNWRFGLRLFPTKDIPFSTTSRHIKEGNIDIQLAVGTWYKPENYWENPTRLELGQYNIDSIDHVINRWDQYTSLTKVEFAIGRSANDQLKLNYSVGTHRVSEDIPVPPDFKYFKVFAWADMHDFDLDCSVVSYPLEELASIISFRIGNVTFRKSDLFNSDILDEIDLVVLPCSTTGSTQPTISDAAEQLKVPMPILKKAGQLEIIELPDPTGRPTLWGWAYSVDNENSSLDVIRQILEEILTAPRLTDGQTIGLPLLGTGAGGLKALDVANLYLDTINKSSTQLKIVVAINNNQWFEQLSEHFQSAISTENDIIASYANKFTFRDKNDIDPVLNVKDVAGELSEVINGIPGSENEGMIGIFGRWGRGKTYLTKEAWKIMEKWPKTVRVDFHAWKYQDTPAIWAYLFEQFAESYYSWEVNKCVINFWKIKLRIKGRLKLWKIIILNLNRLGFLSIIYFLIPLSISVYLSFGFSLWQKVLLFVGTPLLSIILIYYKYGKTAKSLFRRYTQRISFFKLLGIQAEVQKELKCLINIWNKYFQMEKIILFVEDIDRCSERKIIEIIDALRVMLEDKEISSKVTVITAIDESILKRSIGHKYSKLISPGEDLSSVIVEYLDKLFIVGIRLGELSQREKDEYFIELTRNDIAKFDISPFNFDEVSRDSFTSTPSETEKNKTAESTLKTGEEIKTEEKVGGGDSQNKNDMQNTLGPKPYEKIKQKEFESLRAGLLQHKSITPRQIRIFYFRYIIAKNLLERSYSKNQHTNIWARASYCKVFINSLILFSQDEGRQALDKHKMEVLHSITAKQKVYRSDQYIDTRDYRELLKVLDVVIAY